MHDTTLGEIMEQHIKSQLNPVCSLSVKGSVSNTENKSSLVDFVKNFVSFYSRGNVSLQNARYITKEQKDKKREVLSQHNFI